MKKKTTYIALVIIVAIAVVGVSGYLLGRSQASLQKPSEESLTPKTAKDKSSDDSGSNGETDQPDSITRQATLYYSDSNAQYLVPETRQITGQDNSEVYKKAVNDLIAGPKLAGHLRTIPGSITVRGVTAANGVATIDFDSSFISQYPAGTTGEVLFIYSFANTLTGFEEIKAIRLTVDGQTPAVQGSRYDFSQEFTRNESVNAP